ncbi:MAG: AAA family ATPase, partial [Lachnospiraceae bacterium]|nr:AAA family ATPase [Lachnospiraceae bacterium]
MKISSIIIDNFKSVRHMEINDIDNAFILVGKNNTGKTVVLDAIRAVAGNYTIKPENFNTYGKNIEISITLDIEEEDLVLLNRNGVVSKYKKYELWKKDFQTKLPSFNDGKLKFTYVVNKEGKVKYNDGIKKNNPYIQQIFPKVYFIDNQRNIKEFESSLLRIQGNEQLDMLKEHLCM